MPLSSSKKTSKVVIVGASEVPDFDNLLNTEDIKNEEMSEAKTATSEKVASISEIRSEGSITLFGFLTIHFGPKTRIKKKGVKGLDGLF